MTSSTATSTPRPQSKRRANCKSSSNRTLHKDWKSACADRLTDGTVWKRPQNDGDAPY